MVSIHHCAMYVAAVSNGAHGKGEFHLDRLMVLSNGRYGVDLFFVLSGAIMMITTNLSFRNDPVGFLRRRFLRIYPAWWIYSTFALLMLPLPLGQLGMADWISVLKSYLLVPEYDPSGKLRPILIGQGWTLMYELYFYAVFSLFVSKTANTKWLASSSLIGVVFVVMSLAPGRTPFQEIGSSPLVFEFVAGMAIGKLYLDGIRNRSSLVFGGCLALGATLSCFLLFGLFPVSIWTPVVSACLAVGAVALFLLSDFGATMRVPRLWVHLGDASYSLYLTHTLVLVVVARGWVGALSPKSLPSDACFLILVLLVTVFGSLCYLGVERPALALLRKMGSKSTG